MNQRTDQGMSYAGSLIVTVSAWSITEWAAALGLLLGLLTFFLGQYWNWLRERREKELTQMEMESEAMELEIKQLELSGMKRRKTIRGVQESGIRDQESEEVDNEPGS
jgi:flagellar biosynthesis/type III secretory pathway M-ring protein FliF/YscJ